MVRRSKAKGGKLNPLGILFFFAVIYFSAAINGIFTGFWLALNLPSLGSMQTMVITLLTAVVAYYAYMMLKPMLKI